MRSKPILGKCRKQNQEFLWNASCLSEGFIPPNLGRKNRGWLSSVWSAWCGQLSSSVLPLAASEKDLCAFAVGFACPGCPFQPPAGDIREKGTAWDPCTPCPRWGCCWQGQLAQEGLVGRLRGVGLQADLSCPWDTSQGSRVPRPALGSCRCSLVFMLPSGSWDSCKAALGSRRGAASAG